MPLDISVIICTYNRALMLKETLQSFLQMNWDEDTSCELLVVDNNSKDNTKGVIAEFRKQNPSIKYIFEERIGLSHARNRGIKEAEGEIVAFVDDDIYFDSKWLQEVLNVFRDHPEAACMGGKSIPVFEGGRPDWISDEIIVMYGTTNTGESLKYMEFPEHPFGLNMAFRKGVFKQVGIFNQELGRVKGSLLSNEEKDFFYRIHKAGIKTIYTSYAVLYHRIPSERTAKRWIMKRYYCQGISDVVFEESISLKPKRLLLKETIDRIKLLKKAIFGKYLSIKKMYWHIRKIKFEQWAYYCYKAGEIRQKIHEAFSFKTRNAVS